MPLNTYFRTKAEMDAFNALIETPSGEDALFWYVSIATEYAEKHTKDYLSRCVGFKTVWTMCGSSYFINFGLMFLNGDVDDVEMYVDEFRPLSEEEFADLRAVHQPLAHQKRTVIYGKD